jgi:hypothetical protein
MVHGRTRDEVERIVERIQQEIGPLEHTILYSEREFKKQRVRYFTESASEPDWSKPDPLCGEKEHS